MSSRKVDSRNGMVSSLYASFCDGLSYWNHQTSADIQDIRRREAFPLCVHVREHGGPNATFIGQQSILLD
jgi:hypothetical protein